MKRLFLLPLLLLMASVVYGQHPKAADILASQWVDEDKAAQLEFYMHQGKYYARVHLLQHQDIRDERNPDKNLRSRKLEGVIIIQDMSYTGQQYEGGTIYSPKRGLVAGCRIAWVDSNTLAITGIKGIFSKTQLWTKVK